MAGGIGQIMQYDRNRDNRITADEIPPQLAAMLRGADRNGDGAIDMQEIAGMAQQAQGLGPANRGFGLGGGVPPGEASGTGVAINSPKIVDTSSRCATRVNSVTVGCRPPLFA